jgi:hypothetical protein
MIIYMQKNSPIFLKHQNADLEKRLHEAQEPKRRTRLAMVNMVFAIWLMRTPNTF